MDNFPTCDGDRQKKLSGMLNELCEKILDEKGIKQVADSFVELYNTEDGYFHHSYGTISGQVISLSNERPEKLDQLAENIAKTRDYLRCQTIESVENPESNARYFQAYKSVLKLHDHISLETIRVNQVYRQYQQESEKAAQSLKLAQEASLTATASLRKAQKKSLAAEKSLGTAQGEYDKAQKLSSELSEEARHLRTEVISILSIFAAIILMFSSGLAVLGNAISAMTNVIVYKTLIVVLVCILGIFNAIFLLLYVAAKISGRSLLVACLKYKEGKNSKEGKECKECLSCTENCWNVSRLRLRLPYIFWFDILIIGLIALVGLAWAFNLGALAHWIQSRLWWV